METPRLVLAEPLLRQVLARNGQGNRATITLASLLIGAAFAIVVLSGVGDHNAVVQEPVDMLASVLTPVSSLGIDKKTNITKCESSVLDAVLVPSHWEPGTEDREVRGMDFERVLRTGGTEMSTLDALAESMLTTGFQATNVGLAIERIKSMLSWQPGADIRPESGNNTKCTIFFGYTSNMISSGVRETIKFLVKHKLVDVIVTTAGGIEEDFIKCLAPSYMGDFKLPGKELRKKGINRIGNLLVPNQNYCLFEDWFTKILNTMADEQINDGIRWTPSKIIHRLGKEINHEDSVYYWAYKNNIPVFSPALTDGSLGDMLYFHNYKRPEFFVDVVEDIRRINDIAVKAACTGMIILGGGIAKHHTCNANLMRNGADFSVFINTGQEFDGSDSGASPDEAVSWGKVKMDSKPVKVSADASLVFPLIVSQTFLKHVLQAATSGTDN